MLLRYLVKCTTRRVCAVNYIPHRIKRPADASTVHSTKLLKHGINDATGSVYHQTEIRAV